MVKTDLAATFRGRRVLVTGHTGFKGAWLCEWLSTLGAEITGLALPPPTEPSLFDQLALASAVDHREGDIRDAALLARTVRDCRPDFVFHLAAQSLVRRSYREPLPTWETNLLGTLHVLEALRPLDHPCVALIVTTDKVYENASAGLAFEETAPLGGHDPYSASKAAAEIAVASWRRSFFPPTHPVRLASVRAGNVIGGGDWAQDRIVPDAMRALATAQPIVVRHPRSTRPWQHVLDALSGYLQLAARLAATPPGGDRALESAFNFGPGPDADRTVADVVDEILLHWPGRWQEQTAPAATAPVEATQLHLSTAKAARLLGWAPHWSFAATMEKTVLWYRAAQDCRSPGDFRQLTRGQLREFAAAVPTAALST